jgi:hypothetical protein
MDTRWLTYDELAAALRITPDSARRLVARKKECPRKSGNVRIGVPAERLPPDAPPDAGDATPAVIPDSPPDITPAVRVLSQHIDLLQQQPRHD